MRKFLFTIALIAGCSRPTPPPTAAVQPPTVVITMSYADACKLADERREIVNLLLKKKVQLEGAQARGGDISPERIAEVQEQYDHHHKRLMDAFAIKERLEPKP